VIRLRCQCENCPCGATPLHSPPLSFDSAILTDDAAMQNWVNEDHRETSFTFVPAGRASWYGKRLLHRQEIKKWLGELHPYANRPVYMRGAKWVRRARWGSAKADPYPYEGSSDNMALRHIAERYFRMTKHTCPDQPYCQHEQCASDFIARMEDKGLSPAGTRGHAWVLDPLKGQVWVDGKEISLALWEEREAERLAVKENPVPSLPPKRPERWVWSAPRRRNTLTRRDREKAALIALECLGLD
jgi:hypothetical protein